MVRFRRYCHHKRGHSKRPEMFRHNQLLKIGPLLNEWHSNMMRSAVISFSNNSPTLLSKHRGSTLSDHRRCSDSSFIGSDSARNLRGWYQINIRNPSRIHRVSPGTSLGLKSAIMSSATSRPHKAVIEDVKDGRFKRKDAAFRSWVKADGSTPFGPEAGRYRLYISLACPWASRCFMVLSLKGLLHAIPVTVVHYYMGENGWRFVTEDEKDRPNMCEPEPEFGLKHIRELYIKANEEYDGRFTVPVLWDTKLNTIVSNESSEIIVMLNNEFQSIASNKEADFYPLAMRETIDDVANSFYNTLNNGVYRCGFATTQEAYEEAFDELFATMDMLEEHLSKSRYICGSELTLADVRLFPTLIRFDAVYVVHFLTNLRMLKEYPNLVGYTRELYQMPEIRKTVDFSHIKAHYFLSHPSINPIRVIPKGPDLTYLDEPHGRDAK